MNLNASITLTTGSPSVSLGGRKTGGGVSGSDWRGVGSGWERLEEGGGWLGATGEGGGLARSDWRGWGVARSDWRGVGGGWERTGEGGGGG